MGAGQGREPPSANAGRAQPTAVDGPAWQVQCEGQSPSAAQTMGFTWQAMRPVGVQLQLGAGRAASPSIGGGGVATSALPASKATVGGPEGEGGVALPEGGELEDPPALAAAPPELLQPQVCSGTQRKPSPQSEATSHAARYRGMHELTVVDVQFCTGAGAAHPPSLEQAKPGAVHAELVDVWHTMSVAQSVSVWHAPGTHPFTTIGVQAGGEGQVPPGAHAGGEAHAVPPTTAQRNP